MNNVRTWLAGIGLGQYADVFEANDVEMDLLKDVDDKRLKDIGMTFGPPAPVDFGHVKAVTGCDPEGNVIELVQTIHNWDCNLAVLLPRKV